MIKINVYYWNNGAGVLTHVKLIKYLLLHYDVICYDMSLNNTFRKSNLGIFIQNVWVNQLENNKKNIYFVCEEWMHKSEADIIHRFDYIFVNSNYAKVLMESIHKNILVVPFFSLDKYFFPKHTDKIIHFKGKSIQKNTELVINYPDINIVDSEEKYLTENEVINKLNNYDIHICCSLYESWGHYLWEAMSCGKLVICSEIPVFKEYLDLNLVKFIPTEKIVKFDINSRFLKETAYPFRKGYYVNRNTFEELLNNKEELFEFQKNNSDNIRNYFLDINRKNKQKFLKTLEYII